MARMIRLVRENSETATEIATMAITGMSMREVRR